MYVFKHLAKKASKQTTKSTTPQPERTNIKPSEFWSADILGI